MRLNKKEIIKAKVYRKLQVCKVAVNMFFLCVLFILLSNYKYSDNKWTNYCLPDAK